VCLWRRSKHASCLLCVSLLTRLSFRACVTHDAVNWTELLLRAPFKQHSTLTGGRILESMSNWVESFWCRAVMSGINHFWVCSRTLASAGVTWHWYHQFNSSLSQLYLQPQQGDRAPQIKLRTLGDCAFRVVAAHVWNDLPSMVNVPSLPVLKMCLK